MSVVGVELWDHPVGGRPLQAWRQEPSFAARLAEAVAARFPRLDAVHLTGGGVTATIVAALAAPRIVVTHTDDPFAPARAGAALTGACADVGQTSIKLVKGGLARRIPRDLGRAPMRDEVPSDRREQARLATIDAIAEVIRGCGPVLVALPCEIVDGLPRSCSYCWRDRDVELVPELERRSGARIQIVNDAVLAASTAPTRAGTTLVLTIGFGVGAALIHR